MTAEVRPERRGGWSRIPLRTQLPAIGLVVLLGVGAVIRPFAPVAFVAVLVLYVVARWRGGSSAALAAVLPAAAVLVWRSLPAPLADPVTDCTSLTSPVAVWRLMAAGLVIGLVVLLVLERRATFAELGVRASSRRVGLLAVAAALVVAPLAIWAGNLVGGLFGDVFFGGFELDFGRPAAVLPALVFAASNAVAEELAYRGAMRAWLAPSLGIVGANLGQAIVFGLSHTGDDFVGAAAVIPTAAAMVLAGFVGGVIVRRTGSLLLVVAVHLAADIPLYYYWACRAG